MEKTGNAKKHTGLYLLILCNILLITAAVLFTVRYSESIQAQKEAVSKQNFCTNVDTMRQISERYLDGELENVESWKSYIERWHMTKDEALDYIRTIEDGDAREAHIIDMQTYEAWSSNETGGNNEIKIYRQTHQSTDAYAQEWIGITQKIFDGEKSVLSLYSIWESGRRVIGVGTRVTLREADGTDRDYLLMCAILVSHIKELWVFPTGFTGAEIGLINTKADYIVPSESMKSATFMEFVRYYNFADDYNGANRLLAQLKEQDNGVLELYNSKKPRQLCYWYYSRLEGFQNIDMIGCIPEENLIPEVDSLSIVYVVAALMLLIGVANTAYVLSINRRLMETTNVAERANQSKTQFLSTMSHDIRTPLNAVLGMTELAQSRIDDKEYVKECLRKISVSGNHLLTLINDVLEISRVESGRIHVNSMPFDVPLMISGLESITRSQATDHGLDFRVEIGELPCTVLVGDRLRLTQVYLNLLNNAVKYTKPGGYVRLKVWEETAAENRVTLICVVEDSGVGMSPEFQQTMYESFTRVADSRTDKIQGTGLGLAIVRKMVDLMAGTIACESAPGKGTTFTVSIPLSVSEEQPMVADRANSAADAGNDLKGISILIAEDNDLNWEIISTMLSGYGIRCTRAENGRECVDMLTSAPPDTYAMVLMDIQMPVLNGLDTARELRSCGRADLQKIPIAAMTADAFAEDVQNCIDAGMNGHVAKPIEIDKVLSVIRRLLARVKADESR